MNQVGVKGATDITGFGFLGHLWELADASHTGAEVWSDQLPVWPEALSFADMGLIPAGAHRNRNYLGEKVCADKDVPQNLLDCMYDPANQWRFANGGSTRASRCFSGSFKYCTGALCRGWLFDRGIW